MFKNTFFITNLVILSFFVNISTISAKSVSTSIPLSVNITSHFNNQEVVLYETLKPFPEYSAFETITANITGGSGLYKTEWRFFGPSSRNGDDWQGGRNDAYINSSSASYKFIFHNGGVWKVQLIVTDSLGQVTNGFVNINVIDPRPYEKPSLKVTYPNKNLRLKTGYEYDITWTTTGIPVSNTMFDQRDMSTIRNANMLISVIDYNGFTQQSMFSPNNGVYKWTVPDTLKSGKYKIQITCQTCGQMNNGEGLFDTSNKYFRIK